MRDRHRDPIKGVLLILPFFILLGCATRGFVREGATYQDFYRDLKECEAENTPEWSFCTGFACDQQRIQLSKRRNQCMMARRWQLSREDEAFRP